MVFPSFARVILGVACLAFDMTTLTSRPCNVQVPDPTVLPPDEMTTLLFDLKARVIVFRLDASCFSIPAIDSLAFGSRMLALPLALSSSFIELTSYFQVPMSWRVASPACWAIERQARLKATTRRTGFML